MHLNLKQEVHSLAHCAVGVGLITLVIAGIGGTIYKVMAPDGWVANAFGRSLSAGAAALGSLAMIVALAWFSRGWTAVGRRNRFSDLFVYVFAGAGTLYLVRLWMQGSL
jgi:hypothetical protein